MTDDELPRPDTSTVYGDTRPLLVKGSWHGYREVVYTCGHIVCVLADGMVPAGCIHEVHGPPLEHAPTTLLLIGPDVSLAEMDTKPVSAAPSWPGHVEVIYTCGHIVPMRLTDDLPDHCPDLVHKPPPAQTPVLLPNYP